MKGSDPLKSTISVIVPVYNLERELPRCLDSICAQTHRSLEILVVDDGSQDNSRSIMLDYAGRDRRIRTIFQENSGVTSARLRGIRESVGEWITFVDGDDEIEPDMYERLLSNAVTHDADISHCGYQMRFADGRVSCFYGSKLLREQDTVTGIRDLLEGTLVEPGLCNKLFRRVLFDGVFEKMDPSIRINEDLLMNYYLFKAAGRSVFEDWCPYHYIIRSSSASREKLNEHRIYDPIRVKKIILEDIAEELKPDARRALLHTYVYTYCGLAMEKVHQYDPARVEVRRELCSQRRWFWLLPKRTRLLAEMIAAVPRFFPIAYAVYSKYFQKRKYS